jgi:hypothetical protein
MPCRFEGRPGGYLPTMNPPNDDVGGRDIMIGFGGLGLCILAALIVTLVF